MAAATGWKWSDAVDESILAGIEANLRELVSICDGRLFNREPLVENMAALSVSDQTMAFIRDHERLLTEFVVSNGKLETEERLLITLVQACVLMAIKVVRQQA